MKKFTISKIAAFQSVTLLKNKPFTSICQGFCLDFKNTFSSSQWLLPGDWKEWMAEYSSKGLQRNKEKKIRLIELLPNSVDLD